jgi:hypothetical protein
MEGQSFRSASYSSLIGIEGSGGAVQGAERVNDSGVAMGGFYAAPYPGKYCVLGLEARRPGPRFDRRAATTATVFLGAHRAQSELTSTTVSFPLMR